MSHIKNRAGAVALAVATAFSAVAPAFADPGETYYNDPSIGAGLAVDFSKAVRQASGDELAGIQAKAFLGKLKAKINSAGDKPQILLLPEGLVANGMTFIAASIPTKDGLDRGQAVRGCVEAGDKGALFEIPPRGKPIFSPLPTPLTPSGKEGEFMAYCKRPVINAFNEMKNPTAQPLPTQVGTTPAFSPRTQVPSGPVSLERRSSANKDSSPNVDSDKQ